MGAEKRPSIGDLRHRLSIETLSLATDGQGGATETWSEFIKTWGKIDTVKTYERNFGERIEPVGDNKITIRWRDGITEKMRVRFVTSKWDRTFQIKGIDFIDERRFFAILTVMENVGT